MSLLRLLFPFLPPQISHYNHSLPSSLFFLSLFAPFFFSLFKSFFYSVTSHFTFLFLLQSFCNPPITCKTSIMQAGKKTIERKTYSKNTGRLIKRMYRSLISFSYCQVTSATACGSGYLSSNFSSLLYLKEVLFLPEPLCPIVPILLYLPLSQLLSLTFFTHCICPFRAFF